MFPTRNDTCCSVEVSENLLTSSVHHELHFPLERRQRLEDELHAFMCAKCESRAVSATASLSVKKLGMHEIEGTSCHSFISTRFKWQNVFRLTELDRPVWRCEAGLRGELKASVKLTVRAVIVTL